MNIMFFTVEEAQAAQAKEEKLKMSQYSLQTDINTDRLIHRRELYSSPMLNNFLKENQTKTNNAPQQKQMNKQTKNIESKEKERGNYF